MSAPAPLPVAPPPGVRIEARGGDAAEIWVYGQVGDCAFCGESVTAKTFRQELKALGPVRELNIRINSEGGSVFDGMAIYNALTEHRARKVVHIDGLAASIASVIAMAGDEIHMGEGARMMIHEPHASVLSAKAAELRRLAVLLEDITESIANIYTARSLQPRERILQMMRDETWMDAKQARLLGFAD